LTYDLKLYLFDEVELSEGQNGRQSNTPNILRWGKLPVSSDISDFLPCAHAQINVLHVRYAEKTDGQGSGFRQVCPVRVSKRKIIEV